MALCKGRVLEEALPLLAAAGLAPEMDVRRTRRLVVPGPENLRFLIIRAADVCTFVERGAADLGIVGRDLLMELTPHVFEPLDLGIGRCRLCVAAPEAVVAQGMPSAGSRIRVATKYDRLARRHFLAKGVAADIIHLYGSMELAPLVGLADRIVDLVSTGNTLRANGLVEEETLAEISSRLIVNPASFATRKEEIQGIIERLQRVVDAGGEAE